MEAVEQKGKKVVRAVIIGQNVDTEAGPLSSACCPTEDREQDVLDPQERHQDERGPHGFHVEAGLRLVGDLQFGDEHSHNVQQKEQVDLRGDSSREGISKPV
ncbi:hypothetical protein EYF80_045152 [Liparis tanakae]|uniref:Uncharacterized protein n=1 Tax=Liparis tanakae TaxID=230148 RepID=A0A4Z2FV11_9TELE|nr:hypothetical protein EYF80_045152 [Liparis tanakae]